MLPPEAQYIVYAVWAIVGIAFALYGLELFTLSQIGKRGVRTEGKIIRKFMRRGKNTKVYYLEVEFSNKMRTVEGRYKVTAKAWHETKEGDKVPVIYLPGNPKKCHNPDLLSDTWSMMALKGLFFLFVLCVIVATQAYPEQTEALIARFMPTQRQE